jgi:hypothetical protein
MCSETTFSSEEYADIMFEYGFCDGNARTAVEEYLLRIPDRRVQDRLVFSNVYQSIRKTGAVPQRNYERPQRRRTTRLSARKFYSHMKLPSTDME